MLCAVCEKNTNDSLYWTACNHTIHWNCFQNLDKVKRAKICATCKRPVLKAALRRVMEGQHLNIEIMEKNKIIEQLRRQINQTTEANIQFTAQLQNYKMMTDSMSEISKSAIDNRLIQRLTEQIAFVTKLHNQKKIALEFLATEFTNQTGRPIPFHIHQLVHADVDRAAALDVYATRLINTATELATSYRNTLMQTINNEVIREQDQQLKSETRATSPAPSGSTVISD